MRKFSMDRDKLLILIQTDPEAVVDLIIQLYERVQALEAQLAKNSQNSSKPPSSDGIRKPLKTTSLREKSGKKQGGQPRHSANNLKINPNPDLIEYYKVVHCEHCGKSLDNQNTHEYCKRQVFDIPQICMQVTEHLAEIKTCSCGHTTTAAFPDLVKQIVQYGPNITALALTLHTTQFVPYQRMSDFFYELFSHRISTGTLVRMTERSYLQLEDFETEAKKLILTSQVLHADETGASVNGKLHWAHVISNKTISLFFAHARRGWDAIQDIGILCAYNGVLIHDFMKSYLRLSCVHGLCNAHILRELRFQKDEMKQLWAGKIIGILLLLKSLSETLRYPCRSKDFQKAMRSYDRLIKIALIENPPVCSSGKRGRTAQSSTRNLLIRLSEHRNDILRFAFDRKIPFDNNQAERDIRMFKVKAKISCCFRSKKGIDVFCRLRSYASTIRKRGTGMYEGFLTLATGSPLAIFG